MAALVGNMNVMTTRYALPAKGDRDGSGEAVTAHIMIAQSEAGEALVATGSKVRCVESLSGYRSAWT
jgi:hypothetical protein